MLPKLELIAAACENMGIGIKGNLPWRLKTEMEYFTRMTTKTKDNNKKNVVLMGRRTWDCLPKKDYGDKAIVCESMLDALETIADMKSKVEKVWVIGGSRVYKEAMESPYFNRLYLTRVRKNFECDTFFPPIPDNFVLIQDPAVPQDVQEENGIEFVYEVYEKR
ncbi:dihydrofolate reductase isoform X2 [Odontomachus brunneus]|uniref:dihydrofolate reductase isoform X2 n=1 Tax=Odontomachus brunneus TaxID=486640 RepID=UPI0013F27C6F|nr:dihydrofolate reductase isoform X2 [Odontomachus brunneus]